MMNLLASDQTHRRLRLGVGLVLLAGFLVQAQRAMTDTATDATAPVQAEAPAILDPGAAYAAAPARTPAESETLEARAARDPVAFFEGLIDRYDRSVRDYTCTFTKQERIAGRLTEEQVMRAMFREQPFSVRLEWVQNADKAARVLYVADRWLDEGRQMAVVDPAGAIASLFVKHVMRPIHGEDARKSSRRTIDQFGLRNALDLTLKYCRISQEQGKLDFSFVGTSEVEGRETIVFERRLPYTGEDGEWPDRVLVVHIDRELLLPTLCMAYADDDKQILLGKYMNTDIKLNAGISDETFTKKGMGL